jgi:hypothetical protein
MSLLAVNKVREFKRVSDEEDRSVVTNHVVVALFGVKFQSESSWISSNIWGSFFSSNSREPSKSWSSLAYSI